MVQVSPIWFHLEPERTLEVPRMAIAVTDELQESVGSDSNRALRAVCGRSGFFLQNRANWCGLNGVWL